MNPDSGAIEEKSGSNHSQKDSSSNSMVADRVVLEIFRSGQSKTKYKAYIEFHK